MKAKKDHHEVNDLNALVDGVKTGLSGVKRADTATSQAAG
jgi:hypothetical protein